MFKFEGNIGDLNKESQKKGAREEEIKKLDQELEDEFEHIKDMPSSGSSAVGFTEMMGIAKDHPKILEFFENANDVLEDHNQGRLAYLQDRYLSGELTEEELKELEENYFNPYFEKTMTEPDS